MPNDPASETAAAAELFLLARKVERILLGRLERWERPADLLALSVVALRMAACLLDVRPFDVAMTVGHKQGAAPDMQAAFTFGHERAE